MTDLELAEDAKQIREDEITKLTNIILATTVKHGLWSYSMSKDNRIAYVESIKKDIEIWMNQLPWIAR